MYTTILKIDNVRKDYGKTKALDSVSFTLSRGRVLGLMGPNGSGKTTVIKIIASLLKPSSGNVFVCNKKIGFETKELVAFLPDRNILPKWMSVHDAISFYDDYFKNFNTEKAYDLLNLMKLKKNQKTSTMSKGMIEKLNLTLCFSRNAKLFLLDEPLGGIDPVARERIVSTIVKSYSADSSIIVSTHLVHDIENMFDSVCFIDEGSIVLAGDAEELRIEHSMSIDQLYIKQFGEKY
ncbi:MAG TPA: ABC transporter ATP-binding protein [Treponemataceae bacterium]|nr:ABC transporter ATP-binding protein [Treponemataceae bacterium]